MSPLAKQAAAGLESIAANTFGFRDFPTLGMELLHLVGNTLFLLGVLALLIGTPFSNRRGAATIAFVFEGTHLLEHIILTSSVLNGSPAWGSSTLFANISGAQLSTHRIWWHFVMNIAAGAIFVGFAATWTDHNRQEHHHRFADLSELPTSTSCSLQRRGGDRVPFRLEYLRGSYHRTSAKPSHIHRVAPLSGSDPNDPSQIRHRGIRHRGNYEHYGDYKVTLTCTGNHCP